MDRGAAEPRLTLTSMGRGRDDGFALVLVMGTMALLAILLIALTATVLRGFTSARLHQRFDASGDAARAGVDAVLATLKQNPNFAVGPDVPAGVATNGWSSTAAERAWVTATLTALAASPANIVTTPAGRYVVARPFGVRSVYALGWPLTAKSPADGRVVKAEYTYKNATPGAAVLTTGDVNVGGDLDVQLAPGVTGTSDVHTNGSILTTAPINDPNGTVSASGTAARGTPGTPIQPVPAIDPRYAYGVYAPLYAGTWWDLCPDGLAHGAAASGVPCTGAVIATPASWSWTASSSTWNESAPGPSGVYYVYRGNVNVSYNNYTTPINQTIFTEATANRSCPKTDGTFTMTKASLRAYIPGVIVMSGNSIDIGNNSDLKGGAVVAQDSFSLTTSSAPGIVGYVIAENICPGETNTLQGSRVQYDPAVTLATLGSMSVTAELEMLGAAHS